MWCVFKTVFATWLWTTVALWLLSSVKTPIKSQRNYEICLIVNSHQWTKIKSAAEPNQPSVRSVTSHDGKATLLSLVCFVKVDRFCLCSTGDNKFLGNQTFPLYSFHASNNPWHVDFKKHLSPFDLNTLAYAWRHIWLSYFSTQCRGNSYIRRI